MLKEFIKSVSKTSVIVIGDIILDKYMFGEISRKSAEAPIDIVDINNQKEQLGGAANVALSFQNLKVKTLLFGLVGNDSYGKKVISLMKKKNLNTNGIFLTEQTTLKTRIITSNKYHHSRFDIEKINYEESKEKEKLFEMFKKILPNFDFIVLQDYNKGLLDKKMIKKIITEAKNKKKPVMVDPKNKNFIKYRGVKLIKPNLIEAMNFLKTKIKITNTSLEKACASIQKKLNSDWVVLSLGKDGLVVYHENKFYKINGVLKKEPDVTGAGDNVICISSLAIFHNLELEKIALYSNTSGEMSCDKIGTNPIDYNELITKLKNI